MGIRLVYIPGVEEQQEQVYRIRALEVDGRCETHKWLAKFLRNRQSDYFAVMKTLQFLGQNANLGMPYVRSGAKNKEVKEIRNPKHARLFFFYDRARIGERLGIVICMNGYWKTKGSRKEQNRAFERAERVRHGYLEERGRLP